MPQGIKALEEQTVEIVNQPGREFYTAAFDAFQQRWFKERCGQYQTERRRAITATPMAAS
jgi:hypothetical protein